MPWIRERDRQAVVRQIAELEADRDMLANRIERLVEIRTPRECDEASIRSLKKSLKVAESKREAAQSEIHELRTQRNFEVRRRSEVTRAFEIARRVCDEAVEDLAEVTGVTLTDSLPALVSSACREIRRLRSELEKEREPVSVKALRLAVEKSAAAAVWWADRRRA